MENGGSSAGVSEAELIDEEDLFVAALAELNQYFNGVACAAKATNKNTNFTRSSNEQSNDNNESSDFIRGKLQPIAARVLMKILYGARLARFDLLRAVCYLATFITKWDASCDKKLHRLMCYINSTLNLRMVGWVGDKISDVSPHLFADVDLAGCLKQKG